MADLRDQVAFAMWNKSNPDDIRDHLSVDNIGGELVKPLGDGLTMHFDFKMDWDFNRDSYLELADVAIAEMQKHMAQV